ncbi:MAG TPA: TRAP transporter large permease [Candidatus Hydrogenedens sp.]|nr:TRAP transporter large permease [Candidatus Hydrogenedens sp.]HOK09863.1 TRAP transporter large permease [Candidatus Hydrogenedens sp.]
MSLTGYGIVGIALLLLLLMASMPVAFSMMGIGLAGFAWVTSKNAAFTMLASDLIDTFSSTSLVVIPLFVLMGQVAFHSGISKRLFRSAYQWIGSLPGGLAMATVVACALFGTICGSGPATAATMSAVALPEMRRYKYNDALASGTVASAGGLGMMIPPSVVFIVYGILTQQSIGKLFIAGIFPGVFVALLFCISIYIRCLKNPDLGPAGPKTGLREKLISLGGVIETLILFLIVMVGIFLGFFTPTEGAGIGAGGTILLSIILRQITWNGFVRALMETIRTSCMILIIVTGAVILGRFFAITRLPMTIANGLIGLPLPNWGICLLVLIFYMVGGCFIDALALILLTIPIFYPVIQQLGYDPIWFGVMIVLLTQIGVISPPVGINVYVVSGMERDLPLSTVFRGSIPFLWILVIVSILFLFIPNLILFFPNWLSTV